MDGHFQPFLSVYFQPFLWGLILPFYGGQLRRVFQQTTNNKFIALILEKLCAEGLITPKWQRVAADKKCFTSKHGKPLTAKDLSSAKQLAEFIPEKKYEKIIDSIEAVKRAR